MAYKEAVEYLGGMRRENIEAIDRERRRVDLIRQRDRAIPEGNSGFLGGLREIFMGSAKEDKTLIGLHQAMIDYLNGAIGELVSDNTQPAENLFIFSVQTGVQAIVYESTFGHDKVRVAKLAERARREIELLAELNPEIVKLMLWERSILGWEEK